MDASYNETANMDYGLLLFDKRGRPTTVAVYPGYGLHIYTKGHWKWADYWNWNRNSNNTIDLFDEDAPLFLDAIRPL